MLTRAGLISRDGYKAMLGHTILKGIFDAVVPYWLAVWASIASLTSSVLEILWMLEVGSFCIDSSPAEELLSIVVSSMLKMGKVLCMSIVGAQLDLRYGILDFLLEPWFRPGDA